MEKKLSFWQRITSDTPSFFKKIQIIGAGLIAVSVSLTGIGIVPVAVTAIMATVGTTMSAVEQFAVEQPAPGDNTEPTKQ